MRAIKR